MVFLGIMMGSVMVKSRSREALASRGDADIINIDYNDKMKI